ncbi:MAG: DUF1343 domain-containing protein [Bacteroidales bacterium]|jgi:uncharacterized protein YbbC (DUF1343 family)|nr:DUF1343 domain-containing protein [Bacteroidales bacterium]
MKKILLFIFTLTQISAQVSAQLPAQSSTRQLPAQFKQAQSRDVKDIRDVKEQGNVILGIEMLEHYLPLLKGKRVAVVANQTSVFPQHETNALFLDKVKHQQWQQRHEQQGWQDQRTQQEWQKQQGQKISRRDSRNNSFRSEFSGAGTHLVDTLLSLKVQITKIFSPEHGFRGNAEAGENIESSIDSITGLPVISLYGKNKKPSLKSLKKVDIVLFDLQDVGARFYTYISTLQYVMDACAEAKIPLIILDRPNPNGYYVDGPVLDTSLRSFVGMQPIPIVHGLTICEYALMLKGEKWIKGDVDLTVIPMKRYNRNRTYPVAVAPSPNLSTMSSILYYPSLCLFEGTAVSVGRGTQIPFMCYGFPKCPVGDFNFMPVSLKGIAENPPYKDIPCKGFFLDESVEERIRRQRGIMLEWIIDMYNAYPDKDKFFNSFFDKLAGTKTLQLQIRQGKTAEEIRTSWKQDLERFKAVRKKYLLYEDRADRSMIRSGSANINRPVPSEDSVSNKR